MLSDLEFMNGMLTSIMVFVFIIVGIRIILRYFKAKERIYLFVGLTWILMIEAWYSMTLSFLIILLTNGDAIIITWFVLISFSFYPITILLWLTAFTDLAWKEKQKIVLLIYAIIGAIYEILFYYFLFSDPAVLGTSFGTIDVTVGLLISGYVLLLIFMFLITGLIFARLSIKSSNPEIKLRENGLLWLLYLLVLDPLSTHYRISPWKYCLYVEYS